MTIKVKFIGVAALTKEIAGIAKAGQKFDQRVQDCAVSALAHMIEHKDHMPLVQLYQALPRGARRASFASWVLAFSQLAANTGEDKKEKPFILDKEKPAANLEEAVATFWHEAGAPEKDPDEVFDVAKAVMALLKRASKAQKYDRKMLEAVAKAAGLGVPAKA